MAEYAGQGAGGRDIETTMPQGLEDYIARVGRKVESLGREEGGERGEISKEGREEEREKKGGGRYITRK